MAEEKKRLISSTAGVETQNIGTEVDRFVDMVKMQRKGFERRWYDNNFFDDGYHFRYVSRTTGKIVDQNEKNLAFAPNRAIPKASRQIRGVANLILQIEPTPVIYPKYVAKSAYLDEKEYLQSLEQAKEIAKKQGQWVLCEWDKQELKDKLVHMVILAAKHGVSYMQVWADAVEEKINTRVYDAFDLFILGENIELYDSPMIVKAVPQLISRIKANENFDETQLGLISPDNKMASSEIKEAYMKSRYGAGVPTDAAATLVLKEAFIKEYVSRDNALKIAQDLGSDAKRLNEGDQIIRQVFTAGGVWLYDKYTRLPEYPFVDYRFEPGPLYQVPLIERFIPANKSLDVVMSRVERLANTLGVGVIMKRKGENYSITNSSSAQVVEYDQTPPTQLKATAVDPSFFNLIQKLEDNISEQGATTSTLAQLPSGVRSGDAIESLKTAEYANLKIPTDMLKKTTRRITERMLDIAANHFIKPQTVYLLEKGEPKYFDIIGEVGMEARKKAKIEEPLENTVIIEGDSKVKIEVEQGLGFTYEGKKKTMQQVVGFMTVLLQQGLLTTDAVKVVVTQFLEVFQYGATQEFMEAMDKGLQSSQLTDDQLQQIKIGVLETLKDAGVVGPEADEKLIDSTKVGVVEALKDTGMLDKQGQGEEVKMPSRSIPFKDLPPEGKVQMAAQAGIQLDANQIRADEDAERKIDLVGKAQELQLKQAEHEMKREALKQQGKKPTAKKEAKK